MPKTFTKLALRAKILKATALLATASFVLSACATLPDSSEPVVGPQIKNGDSFDYVYYNPASPTLGQTASQVISGFINAGTGPQNDYSVARQFLGQDFRTKWSPSDQVLIQASSPEINVEDEKHATVTVMVQAQVDGNGNYQEFASPVKYVLPFELSRENGSVRITNAPNLTMLVRPVFEVLFSSYSLYFFDNAKQFLVPDLRWFPARASTSTRLVNELLSGPSKWLKAAVVTPLPEGTKLAIDAVTVNQSVATVNLDTKALRASITQLRQFKAQLLATLKQLRNVADVQLQVDGNIVSYQDFVAQQPSSETSMPVVLANGELRFADQKQTTQLQSAKSLIKRTQATDFALSANRREVALLGSQGLVWAKLGQIDNTPTIIDYRENLLAPVFDHSENVWSVSRDATGEVRLLGRDGHIKVIDAPWLMGKERTSFALSPAGSRAAFVVKHGRKILVYVAAVVRDSKGTPVRLSEPLNLTVAGDIPNSVAFTGENEIVALYTSSTISGSLPYRTAIGGVTHSIGNTTPASQVLSSNAGTNVFILSRSGSLYRYSGYTWNAVTTGVIAAHMAE